MAVTILNIREIDHEELVRQIEPYLRIERPFVIPSPEADMYFTQLDVWYAYIMGLWTMLDSAVRDQQDKSQMSKRDYLEKAMSSIKFSYDCTSRRLTNNDSMMRMTGTRV